MRWNSKVIINSNLLKNFWWTTVFILLSKIRKEKGYTQDYVAEQINVSTDLLRSIENGRNIGSITTLLNICNFLQVSPNTLFAELLDFKEETLDSSLLNLTNQLSKEGKNILKEIIIHIDKNY